MRGISCQLSIRFCSPVLVLGLAVPWLLRLVSEEVGVGKGHLVPGAVFCLAAMVALWGVRDFAHRRALSILDSRTYSGEDPAAIRRASGGGESLYLDGRGRNRNLLPCCKR